jgi:hypothetical protein
MERLVLREIVQVINEVINYSPPNPRLQPTLTREFFTSEAPASPHTTRGRRNQNCSRNKDEQFCSPIFPRFPRFARAGARAGVGAGFGQGSKRERRNAIIEIPAKMVTTKRTRPSGPPLAKSSHRKVADAHRSPAPQPSPLKEQNRVVMLREGRRGQAEPPAVGQIGKDRNVLAVI